VTEHVIRALAGFRGEDAPVTTCYLDVDGRRFLRHQDYEHELDLLLRSARTKANGDDSVVADLRRIESYVKGGFDRSNVRGLAIFSCTAHDLWEVIPLPVPVRSRVVINHFAAVGQLESVVQEHDRLGVLLVDKQRARMFVFQLGELIDRSELFHELPRDYDERGERDMGDTRHHLEALTSQHLRHAAQVAFRVFQEHGFERLAIGTTEEMAHDIEAALHPYLRDRLAARLPVTTGAPVEEIRAAALQLETRLERQKEAAEVQRLREAIGAGRRGVAGLAPVLQALVERRVERLLVSQGFVAPGWRCPSCSYLGQVGRACPICGEEMDRVDDVVEEAVEEALAQSCRVEICVGNADLDVLGRIGALLRY
jgi:peptide subunit release factor 1 (eRF1)